ncbi:MAG: DUF4041 domain-containing protein [bacterium]|nr:DUF4041 domain-containing protein [bacterium]
MAQTYLILLAIFCVGVVFLYLKLLQQSKTTEKLRKEIHNKADEYNNSLKILNDNVIKMERENLRLSKWQVVEDAQGKADEILKNAQNTLEITNREVTDLRVNSQTQATSILNNAKEEAKSIIVEAKKEANIRTDESKTSLDLATIEAGKIINTAKKQAEEIAGSAYEAMNNAKLYEETSKAMKNIIEGYGDEYIIPGRSLLDDLSEEFGHTEAGNELKKVRERSKLMVKNKTAATCEYVEINRRDTAINFVIDAFNGKVDSILSRVKNDNVGKLEREIKDAYTVVNYNGKAFREAKINEEYLASRLEELKWAVIVRQLKLDEKEEQRRIREQIREEEKARKEFERAIKEAEKEEDILRKAMEKIQSQLGQANEEQKLKYEKQVIELTERLRVAEEKSQRALSMAQQTKRGYVYIISNIGSFGNNIFKIGVTRRLEPIDRVRELGDSSVPFEFDVHAMIFSEDAPALENQLHKHFATMQMNKVNYRKEFFKVDISHIREEVEKLGLTVKWTMKAIANEYHESIAVEKAITQDSSKREAWLNRQLELDPTAMKIEVEDIE